MNPKDLVGSKKAPLRYVPGALEIEASGPMEDGAIKYGPFNWREQPIEMLSYLEAIKRHLLALLDGQDFAEDSGYSHIGHIAANAGIIADAKAHGTLIDNRFTPGPAADMLRARDKSAPSLVLQAENFDRLAEAAGITFTAETRHERLLNLEQSCCGHTMPDHGLDCPLYR